MFNNNIIELLTSIMAALDRNVKLRDLNMHINDTMDTDASIFNDTMMARVLNQHVTEAMHNKGNILDLVFTELNSDLNVG